MVDIGRKSESYDRENRFELSSYRVKSSSFVFKTVKLGENYRGPHLVIHILYSSLKRDATFQQMLVGIRPSLSAPPPHQLLSPLQDDLTTSRKDELRVIDCLPWGLIHASMINAILEATGLEDCIQWH
jgi:hypothetical protein